MNWINYEWLGYAPTREDALQIIHQTGVFYLSIGIAYLLAFAHHLWNVPSFRSSSKIKKYYIQIFMWLVIGGSLIYDPVHLWLLNNLLIVIYSLVALYGQQFTGAVITRLPLEGLDELEIDDKKFMYYMALVKKKILYLKDMIDCTLINARILWLLILYRAVITLRAPLTF